MANMVFPSGMNVVPMKEIHLPEVARLSEQLGYPVTENDLLQRFQKLVTSSRHGLFVYEMDENVSGWIHLECVEDLIEEDKAEIKALIVDENSRGIGVGRALMETAEKWAKIHHLRTIYLNCNILRERTHKFYTREEFKNYKTSLFFEKYI